MAQTNPGLAPALVLIVLGLSLLPARGRAQVAQVVPRARVLVLAPPGETISPELLATLEIQLVDVEVRAMEAELRGELTIDLPVVSALLEREQGTLAVWLRRPARRAPTAEPTTAEPTTGNPVIGDPALGGPALLHVVGRHHDLAVVRVLEMPGATGSDLDRALALTVAELLDQVLGLMNATPTAPSETPPIVRVLAPAEVDRRDRATPSPPIAAVPENHSSSIDPTPWGVALELGAFGALGFRTLHASLGGRGALALRYRAPRVIVEAGASLTVTAPVGSTREGATLNLRSFDPALELRVLARFEPPVSFGGFLGFGLRLLDARASAPDGRTGSTDAISVVVLASPELRVALRRSAELRVALGVELATERRRFLVDDTVVFDLGWARPFASISIVVALP